MRYKKSVFTLFFAMMVRFITSCALAAGPPAVVQPPPRANKFFTRTRIIELSAGAAMMAADLMTTNQALKVPGTREANPMGQSAGSRYALKVAGFGVGMGLSYALNRTGHYKAARIVPIIIGLPSAAAAIHNSGIHR